jgi:hypothetical protein
VIAFTFSRPFWPIFLHVLGAMTLVGAVFTVVILSAAGWRRRDAPILARSAFRALLIVAIPAWIVMRVGAGWIYSKEFANSKNDPTWIGVGFAAAEPGLLLLLLATGFAFWWTRAGKAVAGRIVLGLSSVYLLLLGVAWLAMSGKWG